MSDLVVNEEADTAPAYPTAPVKPDVENDSEISE